MVYRELNIAHCLPMLPQLKTMLLGRYGPGIKRVTVVAQHFLLLLLLPIPVQTYLYRLIILDRSLTLNLGLRGANDRVVRRGLSDTTSCIKRNCHQRRSTPIFNNYSSSTVLSCLEANFHVFNHRLESSNPMLRTSALDPDKVDAATCAGFHHPCILSSIRGSTINNAAIAEIHSLTTAMQICYEILACLSVSLDPGCCT